MIRPISIGGSHVEFSTPALNVLRESGIEFIHGNAAIVRTLAARGIISSIVSKNDYDTAKDILECEERAVGARTRLQPEPDRVREQNRNQRW
jgi:hypothetical protein